MQMRMSLDYQVQSWIAWKVGEVEWIPNMSFDRTIFESWNMGKSVSKGNTLYGETFVVGFKFFFSQINFEIEQITSNYVRRNLETY